MQPHVQWALGPPLGYCWGGAPWQQTGQCGLSPSPRGEVVQGTVGRSMCPSHWMGGCDCAQDGGWHWLARSRARKEALSLEGEGGWHQKKATCKGGVLFVCAHPTPRVPTRFLSWWPNKDLPALTISHSLFLPGLCVQDKGADTARRGTPALKEGSQCFLQHSEEGGEEGPRQGGPQGWGSRGGPCETWDRK